jgi:hypothetical protein
MTPVLPPLRVDASVLVLDDAWIWGAGRGEGPDLGVVRGVLGLELDLGEGDGRGLSGEDTLRVGVEFEVEESELELGVGVVDGGDGDDEAGDELGDWDKGRLASGLNLDIVFFYGVLGYTMTVLGRYLRTPCCC